MSATYKKIFIVLAAIIAIVSVLLTRIKTPDKGPLNGPEQEKIRITASFYPLAYLAQEIGRDNVAVMNMTPAGAEPHDFEPTPNDVANIYDSHLFIYNGNGLDAWAEKISQNLRATKAVEMSAHLESLENQNDKDPHFWLDPINMIREAEIVTNALTEIDPSKSAEYNKNKEEFVSSLRQLDAEFNSGLKNCAIREIVTTHDAFSYMAKRYDFKVNHILGFSPEEDPSAKNMAELTNAAKEKNIQYIFFESTASPKLAQTIAKEIDAQTLVLDPIEGLQEEDSKSSQNYFTIMQSNLTNLQTAMICQPNL